MNAREEAIEFRDHLSSILLPSFMDHDDEMDTRLCNLRGEIERTIADLEEKYDIPPDKIVRTPPMTVEVLDKLGLAIEQGCDDATQRAQHGNATVDWINTAMNQISYRQHK